MNDQRFKVPGGRANFLIGGGEMEGCTCHRGRLLCTSGMWSTK